MIQVVLDLHPTFKGMGPSKFEMRALVDKTVKFEYTATEDGDVQQKYDQIYAIRDMFSLIESFEVFLCDAVAYVEMRNDILTASGIIRANCPETEEVAKKAVADLHSKMDAFSQKHKGCYFMIDYKQTATIVDVKRFD